MTTGYQRLRPPGPVPATASQSARSGLLRRACACGRTLGPDGECANCRRKRFAPVPRTAAGERSAPAKLAAGPPGDAYEREADRIAEQVMRMPAPDAPSGHDVARGKPAERGREQGVHREAEAAPHEVWRQEDDQNATDEDDETPEDVDGQVLRRAGETGEGNGEDGATLPGTQARLLATHGGGESLPTSLQAFFAPRFGHDFSRVRVHADADAAELSRRLRAKAFTFGNDIYFAPGQFQSHPNVLLAHELVHTLQQGGQVTDGPGLVAGLLRRTVIQRQDADPVDAISGPGPVVPSTPPAPATPPPAPATPPTAAPTTPCPTSVALGAVTHRNHADQSQPDQEKHRTFLSARATMTVGPGPDHTGHCMKERLTLVSNNCPAAVYQRQGPDGPISEPCASDRCLDINAFGSGPAAFIDEHRTRTPQSLLEGTGVNSCTVVCQQTYRCDRTQPTTGQFNITRNYQAGSATRADGSTMHVTTGRVDKTTVP